MAPLSLTGWVRRDKFTLRPPFGPLVAKPAPITTLYPMRVGHRMNAPTGGEQWMTTTTTRLSRLRLLHLGGPAHRSC